MAPLYRHIACCVDDSAASRRAVAEARRLAATGPARLTLVHAAPWPIGPSGGFGGWVPDRERLEADARRWLDEEVAHVPGADAVLVTGHAASAVCEWAGRERPDLLVAASHRGMAERVLLGSFASYVAHHSPVPVLLVRPTAQGQDAV